MTKSNNNKSRRGFLRNTAMGAMGLALGRNASANMVSSKHMNPSLRAIPKITITDLKVAIINGNPTVRIVTDAGISGYGQAESAKGYLKPYLLFYKDYVVGMDPTDVERVMMKIRRLGGFKPWGAAVSAIEMALWDTAGKAAGVPVYKLLGGKIRDYVRPYGRPRKRGSYAPGEWGEEILSSSEGFTIIKQGLGFHGGDERRVPNFFYGEMKVPFQGENEKRGRYGEQNQQQGAQPRQPRTKTEPWPHRGVITEQGMKAMIEKVEKDKLALGDKVGLAYDVGPGFMVSDAIKLARALEPYNLMWLEDMITGDYYPYVMADLYREVTMSTTTPIHTGEQIYLRQNFRELIEQKAVNVLGPDPADMGGIAEMKWVCEYADLHGITFAPHGIFDGPFGLAAQVQAGAVMPENYIAFEYPIIRGNWREITEGLPDPIVKEGLIEVWDRPGIGVDFRVKEAKKYLKDEDKGFFD